MKRSTRFFSRKQIFTCLLSLFLISAVTPGAFANNPIKDKYDRMTTEERTARVEEIRNRVEEIRRMDKSDLSKTDRKELKKELKDLKQEAKAAQQVKGVYLSIGAIIIIILLLILIL
ncbi:MAG TPA: hypothetical protein VIK74_06520 [Parasegetibacter sp.]